jgi:hypothetical protein
VLVRTAAASALEAIWAGQGPRLTKGMRRRLVPIEESVVAVAIGLPLRQRAGTPSVLSSPLGQPRKQKRLSSRVASGRVKSRN